MRSFGLHLVRDVPSGNAVAVFAVTDELQETDTEGDALLESLVDCADFTTLAESEKIKYINDMTTERDIYNQIAYAREEGEKAGLERGLAEGEKKGKSEGLAEGRKALLEAAQKLIWEGVDKNTISLATGIPIGELEKLK